MKLYNFLKEVQIGNFGNQCVTFAGSLSNPLSEYEKGNFWSFPEGNYFVGPAIEFEEEPNVDVMNCEVQEICVDTENEYPMLIIVLKKPKK